MRIGVACAFHESNTFAPRPTARADFGSWRRGAELLELGGTQTATGGILDACRERGWEPVPVLHAWATPSGPLDAAAFAALLDELGAAFAAAGALDGVLLELHGAMVAEGVEQADLVLARAVRERVGAAPIVAVLDPHANLAPGLGEVLDGVIAYQSNPHVDMNAAGRRGAELLARALAEPGVLATTTIRIPVLAAPIAQASAAEPLASILAVARATERSPDAWAASVFYGFAYADVPQLGMHVAVAGPKPAARERAAAELAAFCWELRAGFDRPLTSASQAIARAAAAPRLAVVADTGDNVGGGASGAETELLAAALAQPGLRFAATLHDPAAVAVAAAAGPGARVELTAGQPPLALAGEVLHTGPGRYRNRGPLSAGAEFDQGEIAVLRVGSGEIVLQTRAVMANDQNLFAAFGVDLAALDAVLLKGAAAVRAGWLDRDPIFIEADTGGLTPSDLSRLSYRRAERPLYPLDRFDAAPELVPGR